MTRIVRHTKLRVALATIGLLLASSCRLVDVRRADTVPDELYQRLPEPVRNLLAHTEPLPHPRGRRLPLYIWGLGDVGTNDEAEIAQVLKALDARGIAITLPWIVEQQAQRHHGGMDAYLETILRVARVQDALGLRIAVDATRVTYTFHDGSTPHSDADGEDFFDRSITDWRRMGCPWNLDHRMAPMRQQQQRYIDAFEAAGLTIDVWMSDWEVDGPIEWNDAWAHAKRCVRCRKHIDGIDDDFIAFQDAFRTVRSRLQRETFVEPMLAHNPHAIVGNYGVYAHDGYRIWWDYFEQRDAFLAIKDAVPHRREQNAYYRRWAHEFEPSGYTMAMPVIYTWYHIWTDYTFDLPEYRWLYGMLLQASRAARFSPEGVPIMPFLHWHTVNAPENLPDDFVPLTRDLYQEALWHMLLRGHDAFVVWPHGEFVDEVTSVHEVFAESLRYRAFLEDGIPVTFELPTEPGPMVSALRLGHQLLVRRTDMTDDTGPVTLIVDGTPVEIPSAPGVCQVIEWEPQG